MAGDKVGNESTATRIEMSLMALKKAVVRGKLWFGLEVRQGYLYGHVRYRELHA